MNRGPRHAHAGADVCHQAGPCSPSVQPGPEQRCAPAPPLSQGRYPRDAHCPATHALSTVARQHRLPPLATDFACLLRERALAGTGFTEEERKQKGCACAPARRQPALQAGGAPARPRGAGTGSAAPTAAARVSVTECFSKCIAERTALNTLCCAVPALLYTYKCVFKCV
jgi:hypothetical protein